MQREGGFDDQRERAFGADDEASEVVTRGGLAGGATTADHFTGAGYRGAAEHIVAAGAVFHCPRATGVAGDVAADADVGTAGPEIGRAACRERGRQYG